MSLGSRLVPRSRRGVIATSAPTPREAFDFLYPRWFRNYSNSTTTALGRESSTALQPTSIHSQSQVDNASSERAETSSWSKGSARANASGRDHRDTSNDFDKTGSRSIRKVLGKAKPQANHAVNRLGSISAAQELIKSLAQRIQKESTNSLAIKRARKLYQQERHGHEGDWRIILAELSDHTPKDLKWLERAVCVSVPSAQAQLLLSNVDDNVWDLGVQYGCSFEVANRHELIQESPSTEKRCEIIISGTGPSIGKTASKIMQIFPEATFQSLTSEPPLDAIPMKIFNGRATPARSGMPRAVFSNSHSNGRQIKRPDEIGDPAQWTQQTFLQYVEEVASDSVPNHSARLFFRKEEDPASVAVNTLRKTFHRLECQSALSRKAYNVAIAYCMKCSRLADARAFLGQMDNSRISPDVQTFNIFLAGAAKTQDLYNFQLVLQSMLQRGITPNWQTWHAFLTAVPNLGIRRYILSAMKERSLLQSTKAMRHVCEELVPVEIASSLDNGQSQVEFISHMDSRYGSSWFTLEGANKVLQALAARGLVSRCIEFLRAMELRFVKPDHYSLSIVLNGCKYIKNMGAAVEVMNSLSRSVEAPINDIVFQVLSELAWNTKSWNVARVVWRYACLQNNTTFSMRRRVYQSFKSTIRSSRVPDLRREKTSFDIRLPNKSASGSLDPVQSLLVSGVGRFPDHPTMFFQSEFPHRKALRQKLHSITSGIHEGRRSKLAFAKNENEWWQKRNLVQNPFRKARSYHEFLEGRVHYTGSKVLESLFLVYELRKAHASSATKSITILGKAIRPKAMLPSPESALIEPPVYPKDYSKYWLADTSLPPMAHRYIGTQLDTVRNLLENDHKVSMNWEPIRPFADMLQEAWQLDQQWAELHNRESADEMWDLGWMLEHAISVPVKTKHAGHENGMMTMYW